MKNILDYDFPNDLNNLSDDELDLLAVQIREFLIEKVSKTGGHLASNLGVVELTLALHRVFDFPKDKLIFDVGHQSYVHKILTGRAKDFDTLRQFKGMSGFPKSEESIYDCYNTGHSSNSISAASGMAAARDINKESYDVIAVIGDGSLTGGMSFEAMDALGYLKSKMIIILNDNGMSISKNVGGLSDYLGSVRTSNKYLSAKGFIKNKVAESSKIGYDLAKGLADVKNEIKYSLLNDSGKLFEELGLTYFGPVDGHDIKKLCSVLEKARTLEEPCLIHVITKKGKGYRNAEKYPRKFHGIGAFDVETGKELKVKKAPSYTEIVGQHLLSLALDNKKIVAVTAAMGLGTGLRDFSLMLPERYFDVGIAEEHGVSFAAGLAKSGMRPCVCIYSTFLQRAYDQILEDVCMQNLPVVFALDRAGIVGADGETHQGIFDLSYLNSMPNMTIFTPYDEKSLKDAFDQAFTMNSPCAIRYPRGEIEAFDIPVANAKAEIQILACGKMGRLGTDVGTALNDSGISTDVVLVEKIKPFDKGLINKKAKLIVTIEDNVLSGGFGEEISAMLTNEKARVINFAWPNKFIEHGTFNDLANKYGMTKEAILAKIKKEF